MRSAVTPARVHPLAVLGHARARADHDPHVRPDAAGRHRGVHLDHRRALGRARRRLGSDLPRRGLGRRRRDRRGASLPPRHELERGPGRVVGAVRRLGGRARDLGRHRRRRRSSAATSRTASGASVTKLLDAAAPGLLVAQAIGRIGNWWNQELFGKPTDLPVGARDRRRRGRPDDYLFDETFHPTFLYEALWNLGAAALLLLLDRRFRFRPPALFALYVSLYTGFRFYLESSAHRPVQGVRGPARERLGLAGPLRRARRCSSSGGSSCAAAASAAASAGRSRRSRRRWPSRAAASDPAASLRAHDRARARAGPRRVRGPLRPAPDAAPEGGARAGRVDMAAIVVAFVERLAEREELDLEACGEFLVLIAALLELKARALFPDEEAELAELEPEEAAEELARRLAEYRRMKEAAGWLAERLAGGARPLLPARPGAARAAAGAQARAAGSGAARGGAAPARRARRRRSRSRTWRSASRPSSQFLERFRAVLRTPPPLRLRRRGRVALARRPGGRLPRAARAAQGGRDRARAGRTVRPDQGFPCRTTQKEEREWIARSA